MLGVIVKLMALGLPVFVATCLYGAATLEQATKQTIVGRILAGILIYESVLMSLIVWT